MIPYVPSTFGAVSAPVPTSRKADVVAHHTAAGLMQTDTVAVIHTVSAGMVHVLFARSTEFPSDPAQDEYVCALAAALPGHREHRGHGVYIVSSHNGLAAVRTVANTVRSFHGDPELVHAWAADQALPVHQLDEAAGSKWNLPLYQREQRSSRLAFALALSGLAFATFTGFNISDLLTRNAQAEHETAKIRSDSRTYESELRQELGRVSGQPALETIGRLYSLSRLAPETGGMLTLFRARGGEIEWTAEVPDWVTNAQIDSYGPGITRQRLADRQMLRLTARETIQ
ncbi:MAG: hypothetical protein RLO06_18495 [Parvibaculum sp.]|jgi:hypothetical protein